MKTTDTTDEPTLLNEQRRLLFAGFHGAIAGILQRSDRESMSAEAFRAEVRAELERVEAALASNQAAFDAAMKAPLAIVAI